MTFLTDSKFGLDIGPDCKLEIYTHDALVLLALHNDEPENFLSEQELELKCWQLRYYLDLEDWTSDDMESIIKAFARGKFMNALSVNGTTYYRLSGLGRELIAYAMEHDVDGLSGLMRELQKIGFW